MIDKPSCDVLSNILSKILNGSGSIWNQPLLFTSCNLLVATAINGIKLTKKNTPKNQKNLNEIFKAMIINIAYMI